MLSVRKQAATWILLTRGCGNRGGSRVIHSACRAECRPIYDAQCEMALKITCCDVETQGTKLFLFARPSSIFVRNTSTRIDAFGSSWRQKSPSNWGGLSVRSFSAERVQLEYSDEPSTVIASGESSELSGIGAEQPVESSAAQTSKSTQDLRELIATKERELDILKAALRDKELGDSLLITNNIKTNHASGRDSQPASRWKTPEPSSTKPADSPTMFGKLNLADFPPQETHYEKLQRRRRRNDMIQQKARSNEVRALYYGASAPGASTSTGSNLEGETSPSSSDIPEVPSRPNANAFVEQKTYKSLADRLYEEQFGHPAPANLERTYPPGSFYDRCQKEKKRKEREAAAAAAAAAAASPTPLMKDPESVDTERPIEDETSPETPASGMEPRSDEVQSSRSSPSNELQTRSTASIRSPRSNGVIQDMKPGDWKCPECSFHNFSKNVHCYKCQTERPEEGVRERRPVPRRVN